VLRQQLPDVLGILVDLTYRRRTGISPVMEPIATITLNAAVPILKVDEKDPVFGDHNEIDLS
jgi:hypothetical protein